MEKVFKGFTPVKMCGLSPQLLQVFTIYFKFITKCDSFFYYKVRWSIITKCDSFFITKCDECCYKVRQVLQSETILLQSATGIKSAKIITKCHSTGLTNGFGPKMAIFPPFFWQYRPGKCL